MADEQGAAPVVEEGGAPPQAPVASGASEVEQRLRAELEQTKAGLNNLAAMQIKQHLDSITDPVQRERTAFQIAQRLAQQQLQAQAEQARQAEHQVNEEAKRVLIARLAMDHNLEAEKFAKLTRSMTDPEDMIALAREMGEQRRVAAEREAPAAYGARPDSGGSAGGVSREDIVAKFRGTGQIAAMHRELRAAGFE